MRLLPAPAVYRCYMVVVCSQKYAFLLVRSGLIPYRAPLSDHSRMKRYHCSLVVRQVAIKELNVRLEEVLSQPAFRFTQISGMGRYDNLKQKMGVHGIAIPAVKIIRFFFFFFNQL